MRISHLFWITVVSLGLTTGLFTPVVAQQGTTGGSDPKALAIADQVMNALGGQQNWNNVHFIRFTFIRGDLTLTLYWDKWMGRYRLEGKTKEGQPYVVLMNLNTKEGQAYVDGKPLEGEALQEQLKLAYGAWAGETYWLLMPYKLRDPGAILTYAGEETIGDSVYDKLYLRYENVGLTPGDQFWAYINRKTHLMDKWVFQLRSGFKGEFKWNNWQRYGSIMLSPEREGMDGTKIRMENIAVVDTMPDEVFMSPAPAPMK